MRTGSSQKLSFELGISSILLVILLMLPVYSAAESIPWEFSGQYDAMIHQPHRIAMTNDGNFCISEPRRNRVRVLSMENRIVANILVNRPLAIGVTVDNLILIGHDQQVDAYNLDGSRVYSLGIGANEFEMPNDIAVSRTGDIFVTDCKGHRVKVYDRDGNRIFSFGESGYEAGQFYFPSGIALNSDESEIFVADQANARIQVFDIEGNFLREFGQITYEVDNVGVFEETFSRPQAVEVDNLDRVYVSDLTQNNVQVLTSDGEFLNFISVNEQNEMLFSLPMDMTFHGKELLVTSTLGSKIQVFTIADLPEIIDPPAQDPTELPNIYSLQQNYPNPFNPGTTISFTLGDAGAAQLVVWNILGQKVVTLVDRDLSAGPHLVHWNGRSSTGMGVSNGCYIYTLDVSNTSGNMVFSKNRKMILLK
ncbi:NHL repeat protein [bacterium BMS3Bbin04]|nr:NHL repeat protein [bacterium BMS3Bbin04]